MYTCTNCNKTSEDPTGWARVQITQTHYNSAQPSVGPDEAFTVCDFDTYQCHHAWCMRAQVPMPAGTGVDA
jgi:hypothetical protein